MKIEFMLNKLDEDWWFELGIGCQQVYYHQKKMVFTIALGFATIYIRW
jgi:hypothetical protein